MDPIVQISSDIQSGEPVFSGTRVPIRNLFDCLIGGDSIAEFLHGYPSVTEDQVIRLLKDAESLVTDL